MLSPVKVGIITGGRKVVNVERDSRDRSRDVWRLQVHGFAMQQGSRSCDRVSVVGEGLM